MNKRFIAILLIVAGLVTPMHKESLSLADWTAMIVFLGSGVLTLLFSFLKRTEQDSIYRSTLELTTDPEHLPELHEEEQLYVQPYSGPEKEDIHILNSDGAFVAKLPEEEVEHVLHQIENHRPVHLVVKTLPKTDSQLCVELMC
ncbi:MAG: hypothetical protein J6A26_02580 [Oscillospiraceae bacterium]|nr:hypothetical protein [Oscillospiraceae bacterium]